MSDLLCKFGTDELWPSWSVSPLGKKKHKASEWELKTVVAPVPQTLLDEWTRRQEDYESLQDEIDAYWKKHGSGKRIVGEL